MSRVEFRKIDFQTDSDLCIKFRADSFFCSFGTEKPFWEEDGLGHERYLKWLQSKDSERFGALHIWESGKIIGQLEFGERKKEESFGYVNLYYLIPEKRGKGFSKLLDDCVIKSLKNFGYKTARLSVSPINLRAVEFYKKNGWIDLGLRQDPGRTGKILEFPVHYMEKDLN